MRFGGTTPKVIVPLRGRPILQWSLDVFCRHPSVDGVVLVVSRDYRKQIECSVEGNSRLIAIAEGGEDRRQSVFNGLVCAREHCARTVLVHDGARPFVSAASVDRLWTAFENYSAATLACPSPDTLVEASCRGDTFSTNGDLPHILRFVDRSVAYCIQTPQMFLFDKLHEAHLRYRSTGTPPPVYDDCGVFHIAFPSEAIALVPGDPTNVKITYPSDLRK